MNATWEPAVSYWKHKASIDGGWGVPHCCQVIVHKISRLRQSGSLWTILCLRVFWSCLLWITFSDYEGFNIMVKNWCSCTTIGIFQMVVMFSLTKGDFISVDWTNSMGIFLGQRLEAFHWFSALSKNFDTVTIQRWRLCPLLWFCPIRNIG